MRRDRRGPEAQVARQIQIDDEIADRRHGELDGIADDRRARKDPARRAAAERQRLHRSSASPSSRGRAGRRDAAPMSTGAVPKALLNTTRTRFPPTLTRTTCLIV